MSDPDDLESLLAELPDRRAPAGWQDRVRAAIARGARASELRAQPSRRRWWIAGGSVLAAAAALAIYIAVGRNPGVAPPLDPTIAVNVRSSQPMAGALAASVGDTVVLSARHADELRVYRADTLIARCPGDPACRIAEDGFELPLVITTRGALSAIAFRPALAPGKPASPPSRLDTDVASAAETHCRMALSASIDVP